jgi:asparagine synthase (glutamine-hydrolysing)
MSGILGVWNSHQPTPWKKMLDDLTVLGSDAKGDWHDRDVGLVLDALSSTIRLNLVTKHL